MSTGRLPELKALTMLAMIMLSLRTTGRYINVNALNKCDVVGSVCGGVVGILLIVAAGDGFVPAGVANIGGEVVDKRYSARDRLSIEISIENVVEMHVSSEDRIAGMVAHIKTRISWCGSWHSRHTRRDM